LGTKAFGLLIKKRIIQNKEAPQRAKNKPFIQ